MLKIYTLLLLFLILFSNVFGQLDINRNIKIEQYAFQLDTTQSTFEELNLKIDTIQINIKKYDQKITAECAFEKSKSSLIVNYYFKSQSLILIVVKEQSPFLKDSHYESLFFYRKKKLVDEQYGYTIPKCFAEPMDKTVYEIFGYNPNIDKAFLKEFVMKLYKRLR